MTDRILHPCAAVISDIHVGSPKNKQLDDFDRDGDFRRLLMEEIPRRAGERKVTLIINGDFIDFPQILPELGKTCPTDRLGITEDQSIARVEEALTGHLDVFDALGEFLRAGNQVLLMPGNHDIDLHFPRVLAKMREKVGNPPAPQFDFVAEGQLAERGIHIEHGNQHSYDNWFSRWSDPIIIGADGVKRIERPWGTLFMDIVYNDIEEAYSFVNKVYPHSALAWIILRLLREDTKVSMRAVAQLVKFFVLRGKRMIWGHLLGEESGDVVPQQVTRGDIEDIVANLGLKLDDARHRILIDEVAAMTGAVDMLPDSGADNEAPVQGLLGRTDERGLDWRAAEVLRSGTVHAVVFGHTHHAVDQTVPLSGRTCKVLNTGGWIPRIDVAPGTSPSVAELAQMPRKHDLRYAWLELEGTLPITTLEQLI